MKEGREGNEKGCYHESCELLLLLSYVAVIL